jgi:hypothetical protein
MPVCFECGSPATHQHRVVPRVYGGSKAVPLCLDCHGKMHGRSLTTGALVRSAIARKRVSGERISLHAPYGFRIAPDAKTLLPDAYERILLEAVCILCQRGLSQRAIVADLERQGFSNRQGHKLTLTQVQRIMQSAQIA